MYLGSARCDLGGLWVVSRPEECVELANEEVFGAGQVVARSHAQRQVGILQRVGDVLNDVLLFHTYRQHLQPNTSRDVTQTDINVKIQDGNDRSQLKLGEQDKKRRLGFVNNIVRMWYVLQQYIKGSL